MFINSFVKSISRYHSWLVPLFILTASFIIRFIYLSQVESIPTFNYPIMDEKYHVELAYQINSEEGLPDEPYYRAPLYPNFLAVLFRLTNDSFYGARFIQIILGSFLPLLIFIFGLKLFNRKIAFWSAVIVVFYPSFLYFDVSLLITSLMVLLSILLVWHLYQCDSCSYMQLIYAGVLLGLAGLARPNILLFGPVLIIWVWLVIKPKVGLKRALIAYFIIGVSSLLIILPVTVRNYIVSDDFVFIAWQGGFNFFIGNNREANGWSATVPGIDFTWEGGYKEAIAFAEQNTGRKLKRSEVSDFWYDITLKEIKSNPSVFLSLLFKKIRLLINGYEIPNNQNIYLAQQYATITKPLMFHKLIYFPFGILAPLALIGISISLINWRKYLLIYLFLFSYIISIMLFFVCARYRQPLIPFFIFFAVYAVYRFIDFIKKKESKNIILFLFVFLLLVVESNHDILYLNQNRVNAEDHLMLGNAYLEQNNLAMANTEFKKAVYADSTFARGYNNLGLVSTRRNNHAQAEKYFYQAIRLDPNVADPYLNYATTFLLRGNIDTAIKIIEETRQRFPLNDYVHLKLGMTYYEAGRIDDAKKSIEQSLQINPDNETAKKIYLELLKLPDGKQ